MIFGVLSGSEAEPEAFARLNGFRQPAFLKLTFAVLGHDVGARLASAMAEEFDGPIQSGRVIGFGEAAAFLAWALCDQPAAGELSLRACEVIVGGERRLIRPFDNDPLWKDLPPTFAAYLMESLRTGANLSHAFADANEALMVAAGGFSSGATAVLSTEHAVVALHFGGLETGDEVKSFLQPMPNAIRGIAADARALSVPVIAGSLAEQAQTSLATDEAQLAVIH